MFTASPSADYNSTVSTASSSAYNPYTLPSFPFETPTASTVTQSARTPPASPQFQRPLHALDTDLLVVISLHPCSTRSSVNRNIFAPQRSRAISSVSSSSLLSAALSDSFNDGSTSISRVLSDSMQIGAETAGKSADIHQPIVPVQQPSLVPLPLMGKAMPMQTNQSEPGPSYSLFPSTARPRIRFVDQSNPTQPPPRSATNTPILPNTTVESTAPPEPSWPVPMPVAKAVAPELRSDSSDPPSSPARSQGLLHRHTRSWTQLWQPGNEQKRTRSRGRSSPLEASDASPSSPLIRSTDASGIPRSTEQATNCNDSDTSRSPATALAPSLSSKNSKASIKRFLNTGFGLKSLSRKSSDTSERLDEEGPLQTSQGFLGTNNRDDGPETAIGGYWKNGMWHGPPRGES